MQREHIDQVPVLAPMSREAAFGILENYCHPSSLKDGIASMWLAYAGERQMLIVRYEVLLKCYMATTAGGTASSSTSQQVTATSPLAPKVDKVVAFLQHLTDDALASLFKEKAAWLATQSAGHAIYVPAGCIMLERVNDGTFCGFSMRLLVKSDVDGLKVLQGFEFPSTEAATSLLHDKKPLAAVEAADANKNRSF